MTRSPRYNRSRRYHPDRRRCRICRKSRDSLSFEPGSSTCDHCSQRYNMGDRRS